MTEYTPEEVAELVAEATSAWETAGLIPQGTMVHETQWLPFANLYNVAESLIDALTAVSAERDAAIREMHARELHHFEEEQKSAGLEAVIERVRNYAESIPRHRDRDVNPALSERSWLTARDVLYQLEAVPADVLRERDAAVLERLADDMYATLTDPERVRPRLTNAEVSTDFANDIEWAVQIVRDKAAELRKEQS